MANVKAYLTHRLTAEVADALAMEYPFTASQFYGLLEICGSVDMAIITAEAAILNGDTNLIDHYKAQCGRVAQAVTAARAELTEAGA